MVPAAYAQPSHEPCLPSNLGLVVLISRLSKPVWTSPPAGRNCCAGRLVQQKAKETARIDVEFIECPQPQATGMAEQLFFCKSFGSVSFCSRFDAIEDLSRIRESKLDRSSGSKELLTQSCDFAFAVKSLSKKAPIFPNT